MHLLGYSVRDTLLMRSFYEYRNGHIHVSTRMCGLETRLADFDEISHVRFVTGNQTKCILTWDKGETHTRFY